MNIAISSIVLLVSAVASAENSINGKNDDCVDMADWWESEYRIPQDTQPLHYDLYLFPDLETDTFSGRVDVKIEAKKPRCSFVVHTKHLTISETVLSDESTGQTVPISRTFEYEPNEFWVVVTDQPVPAANYSLRLVFTGRLDNGIVGFYRSVYTDADGVEHKIATSKFQPTYARRAFPCFDEPSFKSTFTITVVRPNTNGYMALSNMPEESSAVDRPKPGFTEVTFQKSVPMVTYLAIFIVCDFEYLEKTTDVYKTPLRVFGTAEQKDRLQYALDIGSAVADYYESYFQVPYPLPKLDMAAIPDYSSGATEHWGLITYRETNLIYDPEESAMSNKERVADVIAHELAHQWFGNLMTVFWWNDLWLNEGFATYIQYKGVKIYETDWDMESNFLTSDLHRVLELDATLGSHPIVVDVDTPDEITAVFDTISYRKYARMRYWRPKFKNLSPWPLPEKLPREALYLAKLAIERITSADSLSDVKVYHTDEELPGCEEKAWIVSGMSPKQKQLLSRMPAKSTIYVEGGFRVWMDKTQVTYFILRSETQNFPDQYSSIDIDDTTQYKLWTHGQKVDGEPISRAIPSVHEQEDGTILAVCATETSSKESLLSWIRILEKSIPNLNHLAVLFTLKQVWSPVVSLSKEELQIKRY